MRCATLIFNPAAGRKRQDRLRVIEQLADVLRAASFAVEIIATRDPGTAGDQARDACVHGADLVFACGGDGTVHEVLQGVVFQERTALGVVPLGSANVLARHLQLPMSPDLALQRQIARQSRVVPVEQITYTTASGEASRYFSVVAGAGADGALVYRAMAASKQRFGRWSYYLRALALLLRSRFPPFGLRAEDSAGAWTNAHAVSAMTVRVGNLGGVFGPLVRGASVENHDLLLAHASAPAIVSFPMWFATHSLGRKVGARFVSMRRVRSFACSDAHGVPVQVQADGEWLGRTPMSVRLVPDALRLLVP